MYVFNFSDSLKNYIHNFLTPSAPTFFAHLFSSLLIIVVVCYWFWKPTASFIKKHKEQINKTYKDLTVANTETQKYLKLLKDEKENLDIFKAQTIKDAENKAKLLENERKEQTRIECDNLVKQAQEKAKAIEEQAQIFVKSSVIQLSIDLTKKLVGGNINEENSEKIIGEYITELEEKSTSHGFK